ncbi:MAG: hypothetical protein LBV75_01075, partial [Paludibacter sp.]|jgi:C-terminal processing protease CtpA/Prc|nr:hypothetical protein [Paludibacter sp.]
MQRFLATFNNGHVFCIKPEYLDKYLAMPMIHTKIDKNKLYVEKISEHYQSNIKKGDEIVSINDLMPNEFRKNNILPYISASNTEAKLYDAIGYQTLLALKFDNETLKLGIKRKNNIEICEIPYINYSDLLQEDSTKYRQMVTFYYDKNNDYSYENIFITDKKNDFAYIKLTKCDDEFRDFFFANYDSIMKFNNLIIDVAYGRGGDGNTTAVPLRLLLNQDTIYYYPDSTKTNNSVMKARANVKINHYKPEDVPQDFKDKYYSYYYNNHFEFDTFLNGFYENPAPDSLRYKGNIYVIINSQTASASEGFALMLSQNKNVKMLGKKTIGALGQPLVLFLPSEMQVFINTTKTYDYKGNAVSSGIPPDYEYDFADFYKTENKQEMLSKFIKVIKAFENTSRPAKN